MEEINDFIAGWGGGEPMPMNFSFPLRYHNYRNMPEIKYSGVVGLVVGHPLDTVKTIQQMDNRDLSSIKIVNKIMKTAGVVGFYKGMLFPLVSAGMLNSVFFGVYGNSLRALQVSRGNDPANIVPDGITIYEDTFIAGCIGGFIQTIMACPSEFIKVRMQTSQEHFGAEERSSSRKKLGGSATPHGITLDTYRRFGIRGLYTGFVPMLWRDAFTSGLYVLTYVYIRHHMYGHFELHPGTIETFVAGGMAGEYLSAFVPYLYPSHNSLVIAIGMVSWLPVVPFDTIKSKMQADNLLTPTYKGMIDCGLKLYRVGGFHILFRGSIMIALRSFPVNASVFLGYDTIMQCLKYFQDSSKR